jgi:recombinational DNA repair protein (RecF pathway)
MQEYVTNAIVLRKFPQGDLDGRYTLLTERYGKMTGKAKSSRKITSKLAPHLEPGTALRARFIEAHGTQIIDALKVGNAGLSLMDLQFLAMILPEGQPEKDIWQMLVSRRFSWAKALAALGWDPGEAVCASCGTRRGTHFLIARQDFFCDQCVRKVSSITRQNGVISLYASLQSERRVDQQRQSQPSA